MAKTLMIRLAMGGPFILSMLLGCLRVGACLASIKAEAAPCSDPQTVPMPRTTIYFSALDKQELPVLGLDVADFSLRVNHIPAAIEGFKPGRSHNSRSIPLVAWILVDFNPNINAVMIANQAEAAAGALDQMHPSSALGIKMVSDRAQILAPLGRDGDSIRKAFQAFKSRRTEMNIRRDEGAVLLGPGGILRAIELSVIELEEYVDSQAELTGKAVMRSVLILSDANINPSYNRRAAVELAIEHGVYVYPIFIPRSSFGHWIDSYFELAKLTGGVSCVFGAMRPGTDIYNLPRENMDPNALMFSIMNMLRDLNGKYSFTLPTPEMDLPLNLEVRCRRSGIAIRLPRKKLP